MQWEHCAPPRLFRQGAGRDRDRVAVRVAESGWAAAASGRGEVMQSHGQLPQNLASNGRECIGSEQVVETATGSFHGGPEDTITSYQWTGDRIWPSGAFLAQDTATRVHAAAAKGSESLLGRHLSARPPLTHRIKGTTPLMVAAVRGSVNCLARLLAAGAPPNEATSKMYSPAQERGVTALMCSCSCKAETAPECAEMMLRAGAEIDMQDSAGLTALAHAVLAENPEVVELLMRYGADTSIQDRTGRAAVDHAIELKTRHREEERAAAAAGEAYEPPYKGRSISDMLLYSDSFTLSALS
eukprot:COSAG02_NODE_106_length_36326_cov_13.777266_36_plen_299_part_00